MARTRNFDPGRDRALHYAPPSWQRHAKRLVYAYLCVGSLAAGLGRPALAAALSADDSAVGQRAEGVAAGNGAPCVACQAISIAPGQIAVLPRALNGARIVVRVAPGTAASTWSGALAQVGALGGRAGLLITGIPGEDDPLLGAAAATFVIEARGEDLDLVAFELKRALAAARGKRPDADLLVAAPLETLAALRERGVGPYASAFIEPPSTLRSADELLEAGSAAVRVREAPSAATGASVVASALAALQAWFPEGLVAVPDRPLTCGDDRLPTFLNPRTLDLVAVTQSCARVATVTSDMPGARVERYDLGASSAFLVHAGSDTRFAEGVDVAASRTLTVEEIVARHQAAASRQAASILTDVATGTMTLIFEAPGFVAPVTVTADTTVFEDRRPIADRTPSIEVRQANIRVNGVSFNANGGVPRLPIIEPERVAAPPLLIALSERYRYRLAGRDRLGGRDTYVVAFSPRVSGESLFDGRVWIDMQTFGMVRVSATQTGLRGAITASEQTDEFARDGAGRWLLARSDVRQTYEGASIRTPIHRLLVVDRHDVNAADFPARLAEAHASRDVMLRDTPDGFRYLARTGKSAPRASDTPAAIETPTANRQPAAQRVLAGKAERIRTVAFGTIIDPNISVPLPFAGLSYVDFNLFGTGTQFNGFFGGTFGQAAFSAPSIAGTRWQLAGRAFAIASSYNDRAFEQGREIYEQNIEQRPAQAAIWLLRPLTSRTALRLEYDWDYNRYQRGDLTAPTFLVPRNQNAHAIRLGLEAQRAGWQASLWGSYAHRIGWRPWGVPGSDDYSPAHADFQRFGASLSRSRAINPRLTTRIELAAMGGRDLDRFSRYAFGTFDNRLRGYPSALIRYDRGAVLRTTGALSLPKAVRLDGFFDTASVRDPGFGPSLRQYTGVGGALEAPGPFRTLLSLEWGYGFQGVDADGGRGTHVLRLSGYKVF